MDWRARRGRKGLPSSQNIVLDITWNIIGKSRSSHWSLIRKGRCSVTWSWEDCCWKCPRGHSSTKSTPTFCFHRLTKTKQLQQWIVNNHNAPLLPKVLVNICRRSGVGGKDITEEKKVSYLSALVTLLQVPTDPQKVSTSGLTVTLDLIGDPGSGSAAGLGSPS